MPSVLPDPADAARYAVGPETITWRRAGDARAMLGAGSALLLQVAHPTVAGGVRETSDFVTDPWGRLFRTLDYVNLLVYGGPEAAAQTGARMREMHKRIRGVDPQGRRYHALEPGAFAWVHATLAITIVASHARFGRPFTPEQTERFWREWRGLGRLLGIRERDLPEGWGAFEAYVAETIDAHLEPNDVVDLVRATLRSPARPPLPRIGPRTWKAAVFPVARAMELATTDLLPHAAKVRLDLHLSARERREIAALGALARATTPVLPDAMRTMGPAYLRWREREIAAGRFGGSGRGAGAPPEAVAA